MPVNSFSGSPLSSPSAAQKCSRCGRISDDVVVVPFFDGTTLTAGQINIDGTWQAYDTETISPIGSAVAPMGTASPNGRYSLFLWSDSGNGDQLYISIYDSVSDSFTVSSEAVSSADNIYFMGQALNGGTVYVYSALYSREMGADGRYACSYARSAAGSWSSNQGSAYASGSYYNGYRVAGTGVSVIGDQAIGLAGGHEYFYDGSTLALKTIAFAPYTYTGGVPQLAYALQTDTEVYACYRRTPESWQPTVWLLDVFSQTGGTYTSVSVPSGYGVLAYEVFQDPTDLSYAYFLLDHGGDTVMARLTLGSWVWNIINDLGVVTRPPTDWVTAYKLPNGKIRWIGVSTTQIGYLDVDQYQPNQISGTVASTSSSASGSLNQSGILPDHALYGSAVSTASIAAGTLNMIPKNTLSGGVTSTVSSASGAVKAFLLSLLTLGARHSVTGIDIGPTVWGYVLTDGVDNFPLYGISVREYPSADHLTAYRTAELSVAPGSGLEAVLLADPGKIFQLAIRTSVSGSEVDAPIMQGALTVNYQGSSRRLLACSLSESYVLGSPDTHDGLQAVAIGSQSARLAQSWRIKPGDVVTVEDAEYTVQRLTHYAYAGSGAFTEVFFNG